MTINELALKLMEELKNAGYSESSSWRQYSEITALLIKIHEEHGASEYSPELMEQFVQKTEERFDNGELSLNYYRSQKRMLNRLMTFHDTGRIEFPAYKKTSVFKLNEYFDSLLTEFTASEDFHHNTLGDVVWVAKKHFDWLIREGHSDLSKVGGNEIIQFMYFCSKNMRSSSIHNVKLYMRKLYRHFFAKGYSSSDYSMLLAFKVSRESRILPAALDEDVAAVLNAIDRRLPKGKRDYAIILLGAVTGLRAADISALKLSDIDWKHGEVKISQEKTSVSLALPLTADVGESIKDYIINSRPKSESNSVFLRLRPPHRGFVNGVSIEHIYRSYCRKAGVDRQAFDGKGFHSLRRAVGKNMATSKVTLTTVAQVLGHNTTSATNRYIPLDSKHLKECSLDFSGIEPLRKAVSK
jgi:integrase